VDTACRAASLHELGLVPTISRMMMTPTRSSSSDGSLLVGSVYGGAMAALRPGIRPGFGRTKAWISSSLRRIVW
jgi:hypothetical protein